MHNNSNEYEQQAKERWQEIRDIHARHSLFYRVLLIGIGVFIGWLLFSDKESFTANVFTELIGVAGTFFILDWWVQRRDEQQQLARLRAEILLRLRSQVPYEPLRAVEEMRHRNWHKDGLLVGAYLVDANLEEADLSDTDLRDAILGRANLKNSQLWGANLDNASLSGADLSGAAIVSISMRGTSFLSADLSGTYLYAADMRGADFTEACLRNVRFVAVPGFDATPTFDTNTILPDRSHYDPAIGIKQLMRFTHPEHPNFWQPAWARVKYEEAQP